MAFLGAAPFFTAWLFLIRYHFFLYLYIAKPAYNWLCGFFNSSVFFNLPQEEEKNLKTIFNTSTIFDSIIIQIIYIYLLNAIIPHGIISLHLISLLGDLFLVHLSIKWFVCS